MLKERYFENFGHFAAGVVDNDTNTMSNVAVITKGPALGHGGNIDDEFLDKIVTLGNAVPEGIRTRFGHPMMCLETLGTVLGRFFDFYREGDKVFARRVEFIQTEKNAAEIDHVKKLATNDPKIFGTSVCVCPEMSDNGEEILKNSKGERMTWDVFQKTQPKGEKVYFTLSAFEAVDFVERPAANADGLYSQTGLTKNFGISDLEGKILQFAQKYPNEAKRLSRLLQTAIDDIPLDSPKGLIQKFHSKK